MALSGRTKISIAVAGAAGVAALGMGGAALADPDGGRTELRIVSGHDGAPATTPNAGWTADSSSPGKDCPERSAAPEPSQAADGR